MGQAALDAENVPRLACGPKHIHRRRAGEATNERLDTVKGAVEGEAREVVLAGVTYERSPTLRRRMDGYLPEIGTSTDLMATAFALTEDAPTSPRVFAIDEQRTLIELIERQPPDATLLEQETLSAMDALLNQKRIALMQTWLDQHRSSLNARNELLIDASIAGGS